MRLLNYISTTLLKESPSDNFILVLIIFYNEKKNGGAASDNQMLFLPEIGPAHTLHKELCQACS